MNLTPRQIELIRESYSQLRPDISHLSASFYEDLFHSHPKMRTIFGADLASQGMRFMSAIGSIAAVLDAPEELDRKIEVLGAGHAGLDIPPEDYAAMTDVLIDTFRHTLGLRFTPATEAAWRSVLGQVSARMIAAAKSAARRPASSRR